MVSKLRNLKLIIALSVIAACLFPVQINHLEVRASNGYPVHNLDTGLNYTSIQEGINANKTMNGHTIYVETGTYFEHIVVNKSLTLVGENRETTIIDGNGTYGKVVFVEANNVTIKGFTVQGGTWGIILHDCSFSLIEENTVKNNSYIGILLSGIYIFDSTNCTNNNITGCEVVYNENGILVHSAEKNRLTENMVAYNNRGICLENSRNNTLSFNNMTSNRFNFGIHGETPSGYVNSIDVSNTVNNKLVYYLTGQRHIVVNSSTFPNMGYLALINSTDVQVEGLTLANNYQGLLLAYTNDSVIKSLDVLDNHYGVLLMYSNSNVIAENTIADSFYCNIFVGWDSNNNTIFHNNFLNTSFQAYGTQNPNAWDNGAPSGGNYWSDYDGIDSNNDGIGDSEYSIDYYNKDHFPLMGKFYSFNTSLGKHVNVVSNSSVEDFEYFESNSTVRMYVSNMTSNQTFGFCRIRIPHTLINETVPITVLVNGTEPHYWNYTLYDDGNNRWIYFEYEHSTLEIVIVPEYPSLVILPLFMLATILATLTFRRDQSLSRRS